MARARVLVVCKIPLLARRTRPKGRPSAARDDRVSCIQGFWLSLRLGSRNKVVSLDFDLSIKAI